MIQYGVGVDSHRHRGRRENLVSLGKLLAVARFDLRIHEKCEIYCLAVSVRLGPLTHSEIPCKDAMWEGGYTLRPSILPSSVAPVSCDK